MTPTAVAIVSRSTANGPPRLPRSRQAVGQADRAMLVPLSLDQRRSMLESLTVLPALVRPGNHYRRDDIGMRGLEPGDLGWVVERHGADLRRRVRLEHRFRGARRPHRRRLPRSAPRGARQRVDRDGRRRTRRMRVLCRARRFHRAAAHSARRAMGTWPRYRRPTGRRVHRVRTARRDTRR